MKRTSEKAKLTTLSKIDGVVETGKFVLKFSVKSLATSIDFFYPPVNSKVLSWGGRKRAPSLVLDLGHFPPRAGPHSKPETQVEFTKKLEQKLIKRYSWVI